jgi:hypothetical protein
MSTEDVWPALALDEWRDTFDTVHMWAQIVGKTRLALAPMQNHWWQVSLYVTPRGLTTSPIPYGARTFEVEFDFHDHLLVVTTSEGDTRTLALEPRSVADFYREYFALLASLNIDVRIWPVPSEFPDPIPFPEDNVHASYDRDAVLRCFRILVQVDRVLKQFRGRFIGKTSQVDLWWGGFDIACTRFSGRRAPRHPGGIPYIPDYVTQEAASHEQIAAGWWPGSPFGTLHEPAFYAYAYPEPPGCRVAPIQPAAAHFHPTMGEWILPYEAVRTAPNPDELLLDFLQSTYEVAADLGGWDRAALERNIASPNAGVVT